MILVASVHGMKSGKQFTLPVCGAGGGGGGGNDASFCFLLQKPEISIFSIVNYCAQSFEGNQRPFSLLTSFKKFTNF